MEDVLIDRLRRFELGELGRGDMHSIGGLMSGLETLRAIREQIESKPQQAAMKGVLHSISKIERSFQYDLIAAAGAELMMTDVTSDAVLALAELAIGQLGALDQDVGQECTYPPLERGFLDNTLSKKKKKKKKPQSKPKLADPSDEELLLSPEDDKIDMFQTIADPREYSSSPPTSPPALPDDTDDDDTTYLVDDAYKKGMQSSNFYRVS